MSSLESGKSLAGIGAILLIFSFIPVVGIIGIILLLVGLKGISDYYKEPNIYQNAIWGVIYGIIGIVATTVLIVGLIIGGISAGLTLGPVAIIGGLFLIALVIVVAFVFYLLAAMYFRRAFNLLAQKSGEHMFETAGLILWIGAILTIIFVGLFLILVAWILLAIAFFSIKTSSQQYAYTPPPSTAAPNQATQATQVTRYCPNCGAPVEPNTAFCPHCGKQLPQ